MPDYLFSRHSASRQKYFFYFLVKRRNSSVYKEYKQINLIVVLFMPSLLTNNTVKELLARVAALEEIVAEQTVTISNFAEKNAQQQALIRKLQAMLFGKKSEKCAPSVTPSSPEKASPSSDHVAIVDAAPAPAPRGQRPGTPGHGRRLYEELPAKYLVHELPEAERRCSTCGRLHDVIGSEDSSEIEWEVTVQRVVHQRLTYRTGCSCSTTKFITAPPPPKLIPKGLMGVSAISHLLVNKFLHGQPINRQLHELALYCGVRFAPGTIVGIFDKVREVFRPLYAAFLERLREANHWHADETRWMQYDAKKQRCWFWLFASDDVVLFALDPTRSRAVPRRIFGLDEEDIEGMHRVTGILSCDRWKSYQGLPGIWTAFCWAHVRRDFTDLIKSYPQVINKWAALWVERIRLLYHLTKNRKKCTPGSELFRQADAALRNHVAGMKRWREEEIASPILHPAARAVLESLARHWHGLILFLDHLDVPLDNNEAERLIRTLVVGRKNFYGSGSEASGETAAFIYSVLLSAVRNGLNPLTYLHAYLQACANNGGNAPDDIDRFLPWKANAADLASWARPLAAQ